MILDLDYAMRHFISWLSGELSHGQILINDPDALLINRQNFRYITYIKKACNYLLCQHSVAIYDYAKLTIKFELE